VSSNSLVRADSEPVISVDPVGPVPTRILPSGHDLIEGELAPR
jgi:hypothetical protein